MCHFGNQNASTQKSTHNSLSQSMEHTITSDRDVTHHLTHFLSTHETNNLLQTCKSLYEPMLTHPPHLFGGTSKFPFSKCKSCRNHVVGCIQLAPDQPARILQLRARWSSSCESLFIPTYLAIHAADGTPVVDCMAVIRNGKRSFHRHGRLCPETINDDMEERREDGMISFVPVSGTLQCQQDPVTREIRFSDTKRPDVFISVPARHIYPLS